LKTQYYISIKVKAKKETTQMKKILAIAAAACAIAVTGCKSTPTVDTMYSSSYAIGVSAALVMN
jgi:hypothetical protein